MLPPSVTALVASILDVVEVEFGRPWTCVALALITYSRAGVSDAEMQDLLSLNDERVLNHVFHYSKPDDVRRFPLHFSIQTPHLHEHMGASSRPVTTPTAATPGTPRFK